MTRRLSPLGAAALTTALLLSLTACGGSDDTTSDGDSASQTQANSDNGGETTAPADEGDDGGSGDAPAGGVTFVDTTDAAATVTIGPDGFDPGDVSVAVGDVVMFTAGDDGIYGVIVSDLDGYTVTPGIDEYFRFDQPGSYPVTDDISESTMTVTVE